MKKSTVYFYAYESPLERGTKVYFIRDGLGSIKIGIADDVAHRMHELQTANPNKLEYFMGWSVPDRYAALKIERALHKKFASERKSGEWFKEDEVIDYLRHGNLEVEGWKFENATW